MELLLPSKLDKDKLIINNIRLAMLFIDKQSNIEYRYVIIKI